jgi:TetR/AcrR family acrAB operon transcriptional repressor
LRDVVDNPRSRRVLDIIFLKCELVDHNDPIWVRQRECHREGLENMESILSEAVAMGQLPADLNTQLAVLSLHSSLVGLLTDWLFSPNSFDLKAVVEPLVDACLDGLRNAPSLRVKKA